ncbi:exosortase [Nibricoccus aquaticus]|uniref:Exosortase n=1 Tax=Nibricoccus aquaticus TaxID=2576891 RepID=A0A290QGD8_9BACT|nr:exosortase/archaeosortase family protein [Nibricoccus aquaticus]ATC63391.1 exosortase [Nibricoccus aquaticus]
MRTESNALAPRKTIAGVGVSLGYAVMVAIGFMAFTAWNHSHWWLLKDDYVFGWLVPFFAGYVIYERWPQVVAAATKSRVPEDSGRGMLMRIGAWLSVLGGTAFFLFGSLTLAAAGASYPASLALSLGTAGMALGLITLTAYSEGADGWAVARLFVFPALVWLVSAPMISLIENALSLFLLGKITSVVFFVFESLGMAIEQQGHVLVLPTGEVGVAEACSGIRSLMGCLFAGSFLGAMCFEQLWKKITLLVAATAFALVMNLVRSLFLTGWAYQYGPQAIEGRFHDWTGFGVIGVTTIGLLGLTQVLNWKVSFRSAK